MNRGLRHILQALAVVAAVSFSRCANPVAPQGGLKDSLPPVVRAITPGGERNIRPTRIFVTTDEYVQLKDLAKEMYTSPLMKTKPAVKIHRRGIRIDIKDTLADNRTYALNFGNAIRDNNEGNPLVGFRYVFSTGPALDSLMATGYAADAARGDSVSNAYVFFYDAALDSVPAYDSVLLNHSPAAVGRAQGNGIFIAQNLKDMDYRVYTLLDNNNNQRYDVGTDRVGFLDSVVNPARLSATSMWLDDYRRYPTADPQLYFRMFAEPARRRQNLNASERPGRHQAVLRFAAPHPRIDTLTFDGIDSTRVIREWVTAGRDTLNLWFDLPDASLPDTLKGRISYRKADSLGALVPASQALRLVWRKVETKEEAREREREEKERQRAVDRGEEYTPPPKANPFRFKVDAGSNVNPQKGIPIEFDLPLSRLDSAAISLRTVPDLGDPADVPFRVVQDTVNIRRWVISAEWREGDGYEMVVPAGTFENVAGERNDSLGAKFKIDLREDFASIRMKVTGGPPEARYIVQLANEKGEVLRELAGVTQGDWRFDYIAEPRVQLRVTEDTNGNGRWDSGSLVERRQPERTEFWTIQAGNRLIETPKGAQIEADVDMGRLFAPISMAKVIDELHGAEDARVSKYLEEKARKDAERKAAGTQNAATGGGLGIGSAMSGATQQIQSTIR